ncbi:MAG: hypothetical protein FWG68_00320 [Defluviitaleaceae bacterium]|nr:hypothetical protein [Defluviitaleaceae bacterium]
MQERTKKLIIVGVVVAVVAVFLAIEQAEERRRWQVSEKNSATVVDYSHFSVMRGVRRRTPRPRTTETLIFQHGGEMFQATLTSQGTLRRVGETIPILVESTEPMRIYHDEGEPSWVDVVWGAVMIGGLVGGFFALGIGNGKSRIKKPRIRKKL